MVYTSHDSSQPGAMFEVTGDLALRQKWPLANHGTDTRYNVRTLFKHQAGKLFISRFVDCGQFG